MLKKIIYFIVLSLCLSLAFSQSKPCCKNKAAKGKVSCKLNQANIDAAQDNGVISNEEASTSGKPAVNCANKAAFSSLEKTDCNGCKKSPWWKFWAKKKACCNTQV